MTAKLVIALIAIGVIFIFIFRSFWHLNDTPPSNTAENSSVGGYDGGVHH